MAPSRREEVFDLKSCQPPDSEALRRLLGDGPYEVWRQISDWIEAKYAPDVLWGPGGRGGLCELKFRRGGRTLCCLYTREGHFGFMVIFGRAERERFEADRAGYSPAVLACYDEAVTYHDGKWVMLPVADPAPLEDMKRMLLLKRRPVRP